MPPSQNPEHESLFDTCFYAQLSRALRTGHDVPDSAFDSCLPKDLQAVSDQHWTPLEVIKHVSAWIEQLHIRSVVDVGSGAGKFCVAAALYTSARFVGLEQRERLVDAARQLANSFGVAERVNFERSVVGLRSLPPADAYYLFNPFGENLLANAELIDKDVELTPGRYRRDVDAMRKFLAELPVGTFVITYNGYGTPLPSTFVDLVVDRTFRNVLRLSKKVSHH
jgi:predicted RNA methylase